MNLLGAEARLLASQRKMEQSFFFWFPAWLQCGQDPDLVAGDGKPVTEEQPQSPAQLAEGAGCLLRQQQGKTQSIFLEMHGFLQNMVQDRK